MLWKKNDISPGVSCNPDFFIRHDVYVVNHGYPDSVKPYRGLRTSSIICVARLYWASGITYKSLYR